MSAAPTHFTDSVITVRGCVVIHDDLLSNDVDNQRISRGHIKASRLSNDLNIRVGREVLLQGRVDHSCDLTVQTINCSVSNTTTFIICHHRITDLFKLEFSVIRTRKATADVQQLHLEPQFILGGKSALLISLVHLDVHYNQGEDQNLRLTPISNTQRASPMAWV